MRQLLAIACLLALTGCNGGPQSLFPAPPATMSATLTLTDALGQTLVVYSLTVPTPPPNEVSNGFTATFTGATYSLPQDQTCPWVMNWNAWEGGRQNGSGLLVGFDGSLTGRGDQGWQWIAGKAGIDTGQPGLWLYWETQPFGSTITGQYNAIINGNIDDLAPCEFSKQNSGTFILTWQNFTPTAFQGGIN